MRGIGLRRAMTAAFLTALSAAAAAQTVPSGNSPERLLPEAG